MAQNENEKKEEKGDDYDNEEEKVYEKKNISKKRFSFDKGMRAKPKETRSHLMTTRRGIYIGRKRKYK